MAQKAKSKTTLKDSIVTLYMQYVLEHETEPKSIYKFCKINNIKEEDFFSHFGSFETLKEAIWNQFFQNTTQLLQKNKDYANYDSKEKMLSFFYTLFELLTLNRSYVLFTLPNNSSHLKELKQLKGLRKHIKNFASELVEKGNEGKTLKFTKQSPKIYAEGAWIQFLFLLKFWVDDTSPNFEKTDVAIEKSVTIIFDVFDNTPLDSILDFGKFLYKETFA